MIGRSLWVSMLAIALLTSIAEAKPQPNAKAPPAVEGVVNLNTATAQQLAYLPRVGATKADRILAFRSKRGKFRSTMELMRVKGIGRKTFRLLRPYLTLDGATTLSRKVRLKG